MSTEATQRLNHLMPSLHCKCFPMQWGFLEKSPLVADGIFSWHFFIFTSLLSAQIKTRPALYDAALNYLLEYRDRQKDIEPLLPAEEARRVLAPAALWMQEDLQKDEVATEDLHQTMQLTLDMLEGQPRASAFCENLRDRAGLIVDYDKEHYIFRHKSFREFLSALQLVNDASLENRIETLVDYFKEDWWEESLWFFMTKSNEKIFDRFMHCFFQSEVSEHLDVNKQTFLQNLVKEAPLKKIDALVKALNSDVLKDNRRRYVMDCLKTIGTPQAVKAIIVYNIKTNYFP